MDTGGDILTSYGPVIPVALEPDAMTNCAAYRGPSTQAAVAMMILLHTAVISLDMKDVRSTTDLSRETNKGGVLRFVRRFFIHLNGGNVQRFLGICE